MNKLLFNTYMSDAHFSPCRKWRYNLRRIWDIEKPTAMFIGLNPSTADEIKNDPTVRRCLGFAYDWGYGGLIMTNAFAFRSTDPKVMKAQEDPVGLENDYWLVKSAQQAEIVVAAWGNHGIFCDRTTQILKLLSNLQCLGTTKSGQPKHPLYLKREAMLIPYR